MGSGAGASPPSPRGESKHGHSPDGGTPPLRGYPHPQGYSSTSPRSHPGPAGTGAADQAVPGSQLHGGSPAVGWPGICPGTTDTRVLPACLLPTLRGVASVASGHDHHLVPSSPCLCSPAPPSAQEPHSLHSHPGCKQEAPGAGLAGSDSPSAARVTASRASTRAGKSSLILGGRERSPPVTVRAGARLQPGPRHPLFAQPAPAGENKQAKVRAEGKGAETLSHPASRAAHAELGGFGGNRAPHVCRQLREPLAVPLLPAPSRRGCGLGTG